MTTHELKTWPESFKALFEGRKTFEWRRDDRGFEEGRLLILREWDPETGAYTGQELIAEVSYVLRGGFGMPGGYCVMSLKDVLPFERQKSVYPKHGKDEVKWRP
ncbi:MAG: DUF3850 domain-containing protein [Gemmatimonadetes bacterium]|nr:DUF3850 domain-containing protein [Gemmatimonadota bacterium]